MKKVIFGTAAILVSLFAVEAHADHARGVSVWNPQNYNYTYIGGAYNPTHCSQLAGQRGFSHYYYGYGYANGLVVYNACFGVGDQGGGGGNDRVVNYDVYARTGEDLQQCADDIEWAVRDVRCRPASRGYAIECTSRGGNVRSDIEYVRCVDKVYRAR